MCDGLMLTIGEDGVAREYKDDYDVVIHCETKEDQDKVIALLNRLTGEWRRYRCDMYKCSKCGHIYTSFTLGSCDAKYCPECGSYNGGKRDGEKR